MKIETGAVSLASYSSQVTVSSQTELLDVTTDPAGQSGPQLGIALEAPQGVRETEVQSFEIPDAEALKIRLFNKMLEALTGKKMHFYIPDKYKILETAGSQSIQAFMGGGAAAPRSPNWGIRYEKREYYEESAQMLFCASGEVKTADGQTINFQLDLSMSRSFTAASSISFAAGTVIDPLVVNFGSPSAGLTARKYSFDLDSDGCQDSISFVSRGSGFLVLDKNGDGIVNNGGELFGPSTGAGFTELKAFDEDGNNWIDENDPIYSRLKIWTKDEEGNDELFAIGQAGIGAIYLGGIASEFELKDSSNALQGAIRETSVFLRENGTAGTIQHVDLSV
jgi:hypothetical protein